MIWRTLYRGVLWLYPPPFRRQRSDEMTAHFLECVRLERARRGPWRAVAPLRGLADALWFAPVAWRDRSSTPLISTRRHGVLTQDLRASIRQARRQPFFAAGIVLMLA